MIFMKKNYLLSLFIALLFLQTANAQFVSGADDLTLSTESYWNGSNGSGNFTSANVKYINHYNASWGSWSGFSYSNISDVTTIGYANQYSAITGKGALNTANYIVGYGADTVKFINPINMDGLYVTNSTYAYHDMMNGSAFSKKFGTNDWFKLTIKGFDNTKNKTCEVEIFLADFRNTDVTKNFVLNEWKWVDLSSFLNVSFITFERSSSDNGNWGMNTPDYFCMDELKIKGYTGIEKIKESEFRIYTNQTTGSLTITGKNEINAISVMDLTGKAVNSKLSNNVNELKVDFPNKLKGIYIVKINSEYHEECHKVIFK